MEKMNITHKIVAMQPELEHFAYKLTADRESANDLVQDCLLKALDNKEKFVHTQNFKGWMYTIMRNIFINNYRKSLREVDMTDSTYNLYAQTMTEGEEGNRFETIYDLKELYKVINAVPEELKKPFLMFVAGFKYREIAEKMDLPVGTIKSRLFLIRKRLQQDLKDFS
ncbi:RNA polymerase sigma factor [Bacteroides fragilis]|uniref:RNA polymerase sigma factor n=1 Tax=Bacteroides TaxID=816 RepID=UPI000C759B61|nr:MULTISPECIES: RNA polymerase sigma factor [Bacteroides]AUI45933.1 RNA polymerase subunit sigma [Bacteroides fragilis]MCC2236177.1 RNA polymerase sigma factor [Bacteroides hominis (ex Afrizal et al. 2022)]MCE8557727.1 RNA polymerase sigma factor [Bacteroides fragilis]MCY6328566.1 RNA polymerase sigma factor [Bacteroides fragilis]